MKLTGKNSIGNSSSAEGKIVFQAVNPASGKKIETDFYEATSKEIDSAIQKAHDAFQVYRNISGKKKADFLISIGEEIISLGDELIKRCMEETGLPETRLLNERQRTVNQLNMFAS